MRQKRTMPVTRHCEQCGESFTTLQSDIRKGGGKFCTGTCYHASRVGIRRPMRTDGTRIEDGYRFIYMPEHPRAKSNGYVREHILVAEAKIGRPLTDGEIVHHLNHVRDDNRPENLEVLDSQAVHMSLHMVEFHAENPHFRHLDKDAKRKYKSVR